MSLPVLYIPHGGGPWPFMDWSPPEAWRGLDDYLRGIAARVGAKPKTPGSSSARRDQRPRTW